MTALAQRITDYLSGGGLFNPELANHDAVRDLLIDCRDALAVPAPEGGPALTDAQIGDIAEIEFKAGRLNWAGFEKDAQGVYMRPVVSPAVCDVVRAALAAQPQAASPAGTDKPQSLLRPPTSAPLSGEKQAVDLSRLPSFHDDSNDHGITAYKMSKALTDHLAVRPAASVPAPAEGDAPEAEEPVFHLRSYGDVSAADLKAYAERHAQPQPKGTEPEDDESDRQLEEAWSENEALKDELAEFKRSTGCEHAEDAAALKRDLARAHDSANGFVAEIKLLKQHIRELQAFKAMVNRHAPEFPADPDAPRDVWYWQGDGGDHLDSMVHQFPVVIRAEQLRELLAEAASQAPAPGAPDWQDIAHQLQTQVQEQAMELDDLKSSLDFYKRRCEALQACQSAMRDPERTMVCDILANGSLLMGGNGKLAAERYEVAKGPLTDEQIDLIAADGMRNAAGGIYETSVHQFARACIAAATQVLQARITSLSREAWEWSKALEAQITSPAVGPEQVREVLQELEWSGSGAACSYGRPAPYCPCCEEFQHDGHLKRCKLANLLVALPPVASHVPVQHQEHP